MSLFALHEWINAGLFKAFNVLSEGYFLAQVPMRRVLVQNRRFKDRHLGERCFVVATGPSAMTIGADEIELLRAETVFAVNSFYKAQIMSRIMPSYYVLMDNHYWGRLSGTFEEVAKKYRDCPPVFVTDLRARSYVPKGSDVIPIYAKHYPTDRVRYSLDSNVSAAMNVVSFAIISAIYMGFKEVYLLGLDYNLFCARVNNHCYDDRSERSLSDTHNLAFYLKYYHVTTEVHYKIAALAKRCNVKIVNLTEGSLLDAYPGGNLGFVLTEKGRG